MAFGLDIIVKFLRNDAMDFTFVPDPYLRASSGARLAQKTEITENFSKKTVRNCMIFINCCNYKSGGKLTLVPGSKNCRKMKIHSKKSSAA